MSLIICYIGNRGSVIIGDKRRIGFFGNEKKREILEDELYTGLIKTKESLLKRAQELGITLKISDDTTKVREIGDVVVGEVKNSTTFETKRKRIYGTTGSYSLVELSGSTIKKMESGSTSIVVFGNKSTKEIANKVLKDNWKKKINLREIGEIFKKAMEEVAKNTPSVSPGYDLIIKHPNINKKESRELLRITIIQDVKELEKWRGELKEKMIKAAKGIEMSSRIIDNGLIGKVQRIEGNKIEISLAEGIEALDLEWNSMAKPGETVFMEIDDPKSVSIGDMAVVKDENLCIMPSRAGLKCDVILCKAEQ
ncbi:MAG: DUF2121 domain-containing protein [Methanobacterium sp.]|nr:DUF2121 domain-containing protein [Methanobacterium sp.]